jgi:hypothetical protein
MMTVPTRSTIATGRGSGRIVDGRSRSSTSQEYVNRRENPGPCDVLLDVYSHGGDAWRVRGGGVYFPDEQWDVSNCAGVWYPDPCCLEHIQMMAADELLCPDPYFEARRKWVADRAVHRPELPKRETSPVISVVTKLNERLTGETYPNGNAKKDYWTTYGWQHQDGRKRNGFKTVLACVKSAAKALGVEFDKAKFEELCRLEAVSCATGAVEEYNKWLSGDCWGVCVEVFDAKGEPVEDEQDSCWGYIGESYAIEERDGRIAEAMRSAVRDDS